MSLNYDLTRVADGPHTRSQDGEKWGEHTETLIFATMWVDMGEITEKNHTEFYRRWRMVHRVKNWGDAYKTLTVEVVKAHIGLHTNVTTSTPAAWKKKIIEILESEMYEERYQADRAKERADA